MSDDHKKLGEPGFQSIKHGTAELSYLRGIQRHTPVLRDNKSLVQSAHEGSLTAWTTG